MTKADAVIIAAIGAGVLSLFEARVLVDQCHDIKLTGCMLEWI